MKNNKTRVGQAFTLPPFWIRIFIYIQSFFKRTFNPPMSYNDEEKKWNDFYKNKIKDKKLLKEYSSRFHSKSKKQRECTLAEISSVYVLEKKLGYPVIDWEVKTIDDKDVDFVIQDKENEIYCEVKNPHWESELEEEEQKEDIKNKKKLPKEDRTRKARSFDHCENIRYAIRKAYPKFLPDKKNLLIINDNLFFPILAFPNDSMINKALYDHHKVYNNEKGYFTNHEFENVGGVLFLNFDDTYEYKFFANKNAIQPFHLDI